MDAIQLRERGRALVLAGEREQARALLEQSLELNRYDADSWAWLAAATEDRQRQIAALRQSLTLAPRQTGALVVASHLGISPEELGAQLPHRRQLPRAAASAPPAAAVPLSPTAWMAAPVPATVPPGRMRRRLVWAVLVLLLILALGMAGMWLMLWTTCGCSKAAPVALWSLLPLA